MLWYWKLSNRSNSNFDHHKIFMIKKRKREWEKKMGAYIEWSWKWRIVEVEKKSEIIWTTAMYSFIKYLLSIYQVVLSVPRYGAIIMRRTGKSTLNPSLKENLKDCQMVILVTQHEFLEGPISWDFFNNAHQLAVGKNIF